MKSYIFFNISSACCQRILHFQKMVALATLLSFFYTMGHAAIGISEIKNPSTATSQDGKITVTATGTAGPFTFKWQDNNTQSIRTNLGPGTYTVTVTNAFGCAFVHTTQLYACTPQPPIYQPIMISGGVITPLSASGASDGAIDITVTGGFAGQLPPLYYKWLNSEGQVVGTTQDIKNLPTGKYTVTVTDGCTTKSATYIIVACADFDWGLATSAKNNCDCSGCDFCDGDSDCKGGSIQVTAVANGVGNNLYNWSNGSSSSSVSSLTAGTYTVTITSPSTGCTTSQSFDITTAIVTVESPDICVKKAFCEGKLIDEYLGVDITNTYVSTNWECLKTRTCDGKPVIGETDIPAGIPDAVPDYMNCTADISCGHETLNTIYGIATVFNNECGGRIETCIIAYPFGDSDIDIKKIGDQEISVDLNIEACKRTVTCAGIKTEVQGVITMEQIFENQCAFENVCRITLGNGTVLQYNTPIPTHEYACKAGIVFGEESGVVGCNIYCTYDDMDASNDVFLQIWGDDPSENKDYCFNSDLFPSCFSAVSSPATDRKLTLQLLPSKEKQELNISPNPFTDSFKVKNVQNFVEGDHATLRIYDMLGVLFYEKAYKITPADETIEVVLGNTIPSGAYWVSIECADCTKNMRTMVQKIR